MAFPAFLLQPLTASALSWGGTCQYRSIRPVWLLPEQFSASHFIIATQCPFCAVRQLHDGCAFCASATAMMPASSVCSNKHWGFPSSARRSISCSVILTPFSSVGFYCPAAYSCPVCLPGRSRAASKFSWKSSGFLSSAWQLWPHPGMFSPSADADNLSSLFHLLLLQL